MKRLLLSAVAALMIISSNAQIKTPAPSPTQTVKQDFGISSIELTYSRPGIKKRKMYADIAPAGEVWRTGANNATTLTFGDEVTIGGTKIPAGKYGLLSIPNKKEWVLIISKQTNVTSPSAYKQESDLVRVTVPVTKLKSPVETFTIDFTNLKPNSCDLQLSWGSAAVSLPITTDIDTRIMTSIDAAMKTDKPPYGQAAQYYMDNGKDLNQALAWYDKAVEGQPEAYWLHNQRANCLAKLGKKAEAKEAAMKSKELAAKAKNDDYVRMNDKLIAELK
jgi:hypothetical protein